MDNTRRVSSYREFGRNYLEYAKMVENLRKTVETCLLLSRALCGLDVSRYLSLLSDNDEKNFEVFAKFAGLCPSAVLAVLFRLGHFASYQRLVIYAGEIIEMRSIFGDGEVEDAGGHIAFLLFYFHRSISEASENGEFIFQFLLYIYVYIIFKN